MARPVRVRRHRRPRSRAADEPALLVALDGVEDPRNLGAILRSAYLLGAHGVIIPEHRAAQVTAVVAKASAGASELLPIAQVGNLVRALEQLRELGLWRVAVHAETDAKPIAEIDGTLPLVLVLGAEGTGVRPLVAKNCDFHALIPMQRSRGRLVQRVGRRRARALRDAPATRVHATPGVGQALIFSRKLALSSFSPWTGKNV